MVIDLELEGLSATYITSWNEILIQNSNDINVVQASVFNALGQIVY